VVYFKKALALDISPARAAKIKAALAAHKKSNS
jgi:hypothetical protein